MHKQFQLCLDTVFRPVYPGLLEVGTIGLKVKPWITPNTLRLSFSPSEAKVNAKLHPGMQQKIEPRRKSAQTGFLEKASEAGAGPRFY